MGLISHIVAYNIGKRRQRRKASLSEQEISFSEQHRTLECIDYYYCEAKGVCDDECRYE